LSVDVRWRIDEVKGLACSQLGVLVVNEYCEPLQRCHLEKAACLQGDDGSEHSTSTPSNEMSKLRPR